MLDFKRPMIVAHRGFCAKYPENTRVSFEAAVQSGAQMMELDVGLSKDGEVVVIHDATVDRTTNGSGPVSSLTLKELKQLDAGSWFHVRFAEEKIPTLQETLHLFKDAILINIEIKKTDTASQALSDRLEKKVLQLVRDHRADHRVLISSFDTATLESILAINTSIPVAWLVEAPFDEMSLSQLDKIRTFSFHPQCELLNESMVAKCHSKNRAVFVWDVRTEKEIESCFRMDADGVFVDDPDMALCLCRKKGWM